MGTELQSLVNDLAEIRQTSDVIWLREELSLSMRRTAESLSRLAVIAVRLEELGDELDFVCMPYFRKIAAGQLSASAFVAFEDSPRLLGIMAKLPVKVQEQLQEGKPVDVAVYDEGGKLTYTKVPVANLTPQQIGLVFDGDGIRTKEAQANILRDRMQQAFAEKSLPKDPSWTIDKRKKEIVVTKPVRIPLADILRDAASLVK